MFTSKRYHKRLRGPESSGILVESFLQSLARMAGCPEQYKLVQLWRNWPVVMGEDTAALCLPLGHRQKRLEVGTEDSMAMQELLYRRNDIVQRANAFLEERYFEDVKFMLLGGRRGLWQEPGPLPAAREVPKQATGRHLGRMDPDSPIARCYRAYCCGDLPEARPEAAGVGTDPAEQSKAGADWTARSQSPREREQTESRQTDHSPPARPSRYEQPADDGQVIQSRQAERR